MFYNATNKHLYSEANARTLAAAAEARGWTSPEFAGFHQWIKVGRMVRKGEKGTPVVFLAEKKTGDGQKVGCGAAVGRFE